MSSSAFTSGLMVITASVINPVTSSTIPKEQKSTSVSSTKNQQNKEKISSKKRGKNERRAGKKGSKKNRSRSTFVDLEFGSSLVEFSEFSGRIRTPIGNQEGVKVSSNLFEFDYQSPEKENVGLLYRNSAEGMELEVVDQSENSKVQSVTYSLIQQQESRDKVFKKEQQRIIEEFKKPSNVWYSPNGQLDSFEISSYNLDPSIKTKFTDEEKKQVRDALKAHWCSSKIKNEKGKHSKHVHYELWKRIDPSYSILSYRLWFYVWWHHYCVGTESRYPNWSDKRWPTVSKELWNDLWSNSDLMVI